MTRHQDTYESRSVCIRVRDKIGRKRAVVDEWRDEGYVLVKQDPEERKQMRVTKVLPDENFSDK